MTETLADTVTYKKKSINLYTAKLDNDDQKSIKAGFSPFQWNLSFVGHDVSIPQPEDLDPAAEALEQETELRIPGTQQPHCSSQLPRQAHQGILF